MGYLVTSPEKVLLFLSALVLLSIIFFTNLHKPQRIFFIFVLYTPFAFTTSFGSTSMYLFISLFLLSLIYESSPSGVKETAFLKALILLVVFASIFSVFMVGSPDLVYFDRHNKFRISFDLLSIITILSCAGVYFLIDKFITSKDLLIRLIKIIVIAGFLGSLLSYIQVLTSKQFFLMKFIVGAADPLWHSRVSGFIRGYEGFAEYLGILLVLSFYLLQTSKNRSEKSFFALAALNFIILLTLTQTRGPYIAMAATSLYFIFLLFLIGKPATGMKILLTSMLLFLLLGAAIFVFDRIRPESNFIERFKLLQNIEITKGKFATRTKTTERMGEVYRKLTFSEKVFGSGSRYLGSTEGQTWPHMLYFSYFLRDGFVGLSLFLWVMGVLLLRSFRTLLQMSRSQDRSGFMLISCLHFILIFVLIHEMKIEFIRYDKWQLLNWTVFGLIGKSTLILNQKSEQKPVDAVSSGNSRNLQARYAI